MESKKVASKGYIYTTNSQMAFNSVIFISTYHTNQLYSWPNSLVSCMVNYSLISVRWSHLKTTQTCMDVWQTSETNPSKSCQGKFQHQYLSKLLVNLYSYCLMVNKLIFWYLKSRRYKYYSYLNHIKFHKLPWIETHKNLIPTTILYSFNVILQ